MDGTLLYGRLFGGRDCVLVHLRIHFNSRGGILFSDLSFLSPSFPAKHSFCVGTLWIGCWILDELPFWSFLRRVFINVGQTIGIKVCFSNNVGQVLNGLWLSVVKFSCFSLTGVLVQSIKSLSLIGTVASFLHFWACELLLIQFRTVVLVRLEVGFVHPVFVEQKNLVFIGFE